MGGLWLDPDGIGHNLVRKNPWSTYFTSQLVLLTNPHRRITNSDLELAALVLYEAILLDAVSKSCMAAPRSGYDNTQTVYWSTHESSMINPVVVDLLRICTLHSRFFSQILPFFTTRAKKIAWHMMLPACFIYLTLHLSPTCLPSTLNRTFCSRYPSCLRNCFPA